MNKFIDVVFDGPPGQDGCRFVEVENHEGNSINAGDWIKRPDGLWALRIFEQHMHVAHYEEGTLTRQCGRCGEDLTHSAHIRG